MLLPPPVENCSHSSSRPSVEILSGMLQPVIEATLRSFPLPSALVQCNSSDWPRYSTDRPSGAHAALLPVLLKVRRVRTLRARLRTHRSLRPFASSGAINNCVPSGDNDMS